ncbi:hypothetical protein B0T13DRAFT_133580 [Neurospora crassa]|nr:hypothetical protein B0T13DRAFT_133580 [Neurospora crassa]
MVVCTPATWALVHPRTAYIMSIYRWEGSFKAHEKMSRTSIGTLGYPSPSRTQPNHALTRRTSTSTLSLKLKQEPSTYTENALSRCKPLQTSHRNYMDQADRVRGLCMGQNTPCQRHWTTSSGNGRTLSTG